MNVFDAFLNTQFSFSLEFNSLLSQITIIYLLQISTFSGEADVEDNGRRTLHI